MKILETIYEKPQQKEKKKKKKKGWRRSTFYVNWAILIGDPVDVTTLLLSEDRSDSRPHGDLLKNDVH